MILVISATEMVKEEYLTAHTKNLGNREEGIRDQNISAPDSVHRLITQVLDVDDQKRVYVKLFNVISWLLLNWHGWVLGLPLPTLN